MTTTLVLLRHGQSRWNLENRFTGWTDVGLTPQGEDEARAAGRLLREEGFTFDLVFTSLQRRAILTADLTLDEISAVGEMVTNEMDEDANVIWGARISEDMKGKLTVMTIVTGVKSPWIMGPRTEKEKADARQAISNELGLEIVH